MSDAKRTIEQPDWTTAIQNMKVAGGHGNFLFQAGIPFEALLCTGDSIPPGSKVNDSELQVW